MEEDSQRALKEIKEYDGQKISVSVAKKKLDNKKKGGMTGLSFVTDSVLYKVTRFSVTFPIGLIKS